MLIMQRSIVPATSWCYWYPCFQKSLVREKDLREMLIGQTNGVQYSSQTNPYLVDFYTTVEYVYGQDQEIQDLASWFIHFEVKVLWFGLQSVFGKRTDLYICQGSITVDIYRRNIIKQIIVNFLAAFEDQFLLGVNIRSHRAEIDEESQIPHFALPPWFPGLNPIERARDKLQRRLTHHIPPPETLP